jgi:ApaG protein
MVTQITNNIKISVTTVFDGIFIKSKNTYYAFKYQITINNISNQTVQLITRHWEIFDSLNEIQIVDGEGVVGFKPVLKPGEQFTYSSACVLISKYGAMNGYFNFINHNSTNNFKVFIPTFNLTVPAALN